MNKLWGLLKIQMLNTLGINKVLKSKDENSKQKLIITLILLIIFGIGIIGISTFYSLMLALFLRKLDKMELLIAIVMAVTSIFTMFTTIYKTKGTLFGFKDYDAIMSLPIKTKTIISSRMIMLYLVNILLTFVIMGPAGVIYGISISSPITFYLLFTFSILFVPFIPLVIATIIGTTISMVASRFKHKNLLETILSFGILILVFIISINMKGIEKDFDNIGIAIGDSIYKSYPMAKLFVNAICDNNIFSLLIFIGTSVLIFTIFVWVIAKKFKAINTAFTTIKAKSNYKLGVFKKFSQFESLYYKELRRYFSSALYIVNTSFALIMLLIMVGAIVIINPTELEQMLEIPGFSENINSLLPLVISIFVAMTCTSACSISLEGKNLWILSSSPINVRSIFLSKAAVNLTITIPTILFCGTSLGIYLTPTTTEWILLYLTPIIYACFISIMGIVINLIFPKMEWASELMVIKQSMATLIAMVIGILSIGLPFAVTVMYTNISRSLLILLISGVIFIVTVGLYIFLTKKGNKLFMRLN